MAAQLNQYEDFDRSACVSDGNVQSTMEVTGRFGLLRALPTIEIVDDLIQSENGGAADTDESGRAEADFGTTEIRKPNEFIQFEFSDGSWYRRTIDDVLYIGNPNGNTDIYENGRHRRLTARSNGDNPLHVAFGTPTFLNKIREGVSLQEDGCVRYVYKDGTKEFQRPDGSQTITYPDGQTDFYKDGKLVSQRMSRVDAENPEQIEYSKASFPDKHQVSINADGSGMVLYQYSDGTKELQNPNGEVLIRYANGDIETYQNGILVSENKVKR